MISVVVPVYNEENTLDQLTQRLTAVLPSMDKEFEIIFINDGSTDGSKRIIDGLGDKYYGRIKSVNLRRNFGKSFALKEGFNRAQGDVIFMIDADLQDLPEEMPKLLKEMKDKDLDAVSGWKESRQDSFSRRFLSKIFNFFMRKLSKVEIHDFNCGLKAFQKDAVNGIVLYGQLHRFILLQVAERGFRIGEVKVAHEKRQFGRSKYGVNRIYHGFFDFVTMIFLTRFLHSPLHFFGVMAVFCFALSFIAVVYFGGLQLHAIFWHVPENNLGNHPMWVSIFFFFLAGLIFVCFGLLGALIVHLLYPKHSQLPDKSIPRA